MRWQGAEETKVFEELSLLTITTIVVAVIILAAVAIYALAHWLPARRRNTERGHAQPTTAPVSASPGAVPMTDLPNPRTLAKVRVGREGDRPSEDDIARQHMGPRGLPGEPAPAPALDESITQIPKGADPGHTA
jgi:hypothetical protein